MLSINDEVYQKMPAEIKALFSQVSNPAREEVLECFPNSKSSKGKPTKREGGVATNFAMSLGNTTGYEDEGSAARFFYCAKASKKDRDEGLEGFEEKEGVNGNKWTDQDYRRGDEKPTTKRQNTHPTVKPTALMRYLVKLVTPPGGTVLDPFAGSGSTGKACKLEGFEFIGIEREEEYVKIAEARIEAVIRQPTLV